MGRIVQTLAAQNDLAEIWLYIGQENEAAADRLLETINQKLILLSDSPYLGRERLDIALNLRSFPVGRYVIFYRIIKEGIQILRVLHGARNVENLL